jgi:predicted small secreted protein
MFKKFLTFLMTVALLSGLTITLSACDTMAGFGQDVSHAGDKITDEAEKNK